jgi:DNA-binding MarR family transcriptional regulator
MREYSDTEQLILIRLSIQGAATPAILAEDLDRNSSYLNTLLQELEESGIIRSRKGVYYADPVAIQLTRSWLRDSDMLENLDLDTIS